MGVGDSGGLASRSTHVFHWWRIFLEIDQWVIVDQTFVQLLSALSCRPSWDAIAFGLLQILKYLQFFA